MVETWNGQRVPAKKISVKSSVSHQHLAIEATDNIH